MKSNVVLLCVPVAEANKCATATSSVGSRAEGFVTEFGTERSKAFKVFSSPLPCAVEAAKVLVEHGVGTSFETHWGLCEVYRPSHMGQDDEPPKAAFGSLQPKGHAPLWGETMEDAVNRYRATFTQLQEEHRGQDFLIVTHQVAMCTMYSLTLRDVLWCCPDLAFVALDHADGTWRIAAMEGAQGRLCVGSGIAVDISHVDDSVGSDPCCVPQDLLLDHKNRITDVTLLLIVLLQFVIFANSICVAQQVVYMACVIVSATLAKFTPTPAIVAQHRQKLKIIVPLALALGKAFLLLVSFVVVGIIVHACGPCNDSILQTLFMFFADPLSTVVFVAMILLDGFRHFALGNYDSAREELLIPFLRDV